MLRGFVNSGNTCNMNSVLQCLIHLPNFLSYLTNFYNYDKKKPFISYLKKIYNEYIKSDSSVKSLDISSFCELFFKYFGTFRQADANEYLFYLFSELENEKISVLSELLNGETNTITKCIECGHVNEKKEKTNCLILSIKQENVLDNLKEYFNEVELDDYTCDNCSKKHCKKKEMISVFPNYLILILNRFEGVKKNRKRIIFPESFSMNENNYNYNCSVHHFGDTSNGHYMAAVKKDEKVYVFDDTNIGYTDKEKLFSSDTSYILFYSKEN